GRQAGGGAARRTGWRARGHRSGAVPRRGRPRPHHARPPRCPTLELTVFVAILRFASAGSYSLRSPIGSSAARRRTANPHAAAPLRLAPTRSARQSVLPRPGGARRTRTPPLRFGWLLLAPLANRFFRGPAAHG